jgi:hypothetical protein
MRINWEVDPSQDRAAGHPFADAGARLAAVRIGFARVPSWTACASAYISESILASILRMWKHR